MFHYFSIPSFVTYRACERTVNLVKNQPYRSNSFYNTKYTQSKRITHWQCYTLKYRLLIHIQAPITIDWLLFDIPTIKYKNGVLIPVQSY